MQTLHAFHKSFVPEGPVQVSQILHQSELRVRTYFHTYAYTSGSSWNPKSNTLEPDRPQHEHPAVCVIAQQYSSATFVSVCLYSRQKQIRRWSKICLLKSDKFKCVGRGGLVHGCIYYGGNTCHHIRDLHWRWMRRSPTGVPYGSGGVSSMILRLAITPYQATQCCNLQDHNVNFHIHPNPWSRRNIANNFIVWRSSGKFRSSSTCNGRIPACNVSKAHDLCSKRQHCRVRTSRNARDVKEWHARHILTAVCYPFSPYRLIRRCTIFVVDEDGLRGPNEGQCPIWKDMFVQIKEYTFPRTWQVVLLALVPNARSPWWLNYEEWCLTSLLYVSLLAPCILRWLLCLWKIFQLLI